MLLKQTRWTATLILKASKSVILLKSQKGRKHEGIDSVPPAIPGHYVLSYCAFLG
jgi:hypothetical protein